MYSIKFYTVPVVICSLLRNYNKDIQELITDLEEYKIWSLY